MARTQADSLKYYGAKAASNLRKHREIKNIGSTAKKLIDYHMIIKGFIALWAPA
jgi:hypothetical protein